MNHPIKKVLLWALIVTVAAYFIGLPAEPVMLAKMFGTFVVANVVGAVIFPLA